MGCTQCDHAGRWYCDVCADRGASVGLTLPRQPGRVLLPSGVLPQDATEEALRTHLRPLAQQLGYLHYHTRNSRKSEAGWPDDALVHAQRPGPLFLWELKRVGESPSPAQRRWLEALERVTAVHVGVYTPADWTDMQRLLIREKE